MIAGRVAERVERRPQHGVVPGPVADRRRAITSLSRDAQDLHRLRGARRPAPARARRAPTGAPARRARARSPGRAAGSAARARSRAIAAAAGSAVSHSDWCGPRMPSAISVPSTATATKLTELLIRKNATERRAIRSAGMPPSCRIQAPSARPPAPLAGTIEPIASSDQPISQLVRQGMCRQKIGRNIST